MQIGENIHSSESERSLYHLCNKLLSTKPIFD